MIGTLTDLGFGGLGDVRFRCCCCPRPGPGAVALLARPAADRFLGFRSTACSSSLFVTCLVGITY